MDAYTASPALVADFLLWVASARSAFYSTLAGYRSALSHVLRLSTGYCPGTCPVLSQLMQSFKRTQPRPSSRVPQWDINLVLSVLCEDRFADDRLSLDILTAKTVFLLALASGEQWSALAALAHPHSLMNRTCKSAIIETSFRKVIFSQKCYVSLPDTHKFCV